jgi:hypothetical protein
MQKCMCMQCAMQSVWQHTFRLHEAVPQTVTYVLSPYNHRISHVVMMTVCQSMSNVIAALCA